eukprot:scaffold1790_cov257-Pinguiococcus_pyrenoidosus.AAC.39
MDVLRETLSKYPIRTRLSLTGTIVVARDIAHAKLQERINNGEGYPHRMCHAVLAEVELTSAHSIQVAGLREGPYHLLRR